LVFFLLIKEGHIPHKAPFGYKRIDKIFVPDIFLIRK